MKRIDYIVQGSSAPLDKNVLWLTTEGEFKIFGTGGWESVEGTTPKQIEEDIDDILGE